MPVDLQFKDEFKKLTKDLRRVEEAIASKALVRSINRVSKSTQSVAVKEVSKETGYKQKEVRDDLYVRRAKPGNLSASVDARLGRAKNLIRFVSPAARQPSDGPGHPQKFRQRSKAKHRRYLRRGVRARAWRQNKDYKGTFIIRGKNNNVIVVKRTGRSRTSKLESVVGPSVRRTFNRTHVRGSLRRHVDTRLPIELRNNIKFYVDRAVKR